MKIGKDYLISSVADAYREASGETESILASELADKIASLEVTKNVKGIIFTNFNGEGLAEKAIVKGVSKLPKYTFSAGDVEAFAYLKEISVDGVLAEIPSYLCYKCSSLLSVDGLLENATSVGTRAFGGCTGLAEVNFKVQPGDYMPSVFYDCTNIEVIRVPWSEGEVEGAPWGALNAEIVYDCTEDGNEG